MMPRVASEEDVAAPGTRPDSAARGQPDVTRSHVGLRESAGHASSSTDRPRSQSAARAQSQRRTALLRQKAVSHNLVKLSYGSCIKMRMMFFIW